MEKEKTISGEDLCNCGHERIGHTRVYGCTGFIDSDTNCKCKGFKSKEIQS